MEQSFAGLNIPAWLVDKLKESNIEIPTEVQAEVIPLVLQGRDVVGQSPTGTGKTLAYLLPMLAKISLDNKGIQALVVAPTRELAMQIAKLANDLGNGLGILTVPILGGVNIQRQVANLKEKPRLVVGTPGRVLELIRARKINAQGIKTIVVDEADKMWQLGFKEDVQNIIKSTLRDRQVLMFSATVGAEMNAGTLDILNEAALVNVSPDNKIVGSIKHIYFMIPERNKYELIQRLMRNYKPQKAIIFLNNNEAVLPLVLRLRSYGYATEGLNSELNPQGRKAVLEKFRSTKTQLLVTTDLFARGMDVKDVEIIFNFDLPFNAEYYIHRVGRTGRAGQSGLAINMVTPEQRFIMDKYEKQLKITIEAWTTSGNKVIPVKKI